MMTMESVQRSKKKASAAAGAGVFINPVERGLTTCCLYANI